MFHRNIFKISVLQAGNRVERSCSLRPRKAVAFLTHLLRAPEHGAGNFAVCGQRLRGHVPSKNTSPAALSWSSLTNPTAPILFVPARYFLLSFVGTRRAMSAPLHQNRTLPKQPQKGCANVDAALLEFMVEMENRIMPQPELPSSKMQSSPPALLPPPASSNEHGSRPAAILRIPQR